MSSLQICKVHDIIAPSNASPVPQEVMMHRLVFQEPNPPVKETCRRVGCDEVGTFYITLRYKGKEAVYLVCEEHKVEHDETKPVAEHNQHNAALRVAMKRQREMYE